MDFSATSPDTSVNAANLHNDILRKMTPSQKAELTFDLSENLRSTVIAGIRHRHPDYTHKQIIKAYLSLTIDKDTLEKAMPDIEAAP